MGKIYISLGSDCGVARTLQSLKKRDASMPFDWVVSYNGVSDIIKNKFSGYLPKRGNGAFNPHSHSLFLHNKFPKDTKMMERRVQRFLDVLDDQENEIIFIRKGHMDHHHEESEKWNCNLKNDVEDIEDLYDLIVDEYPKLNFRLIVILACSKCFSDKKYSSQKIEIYNLNDFTNDETTPTDTEIILNDIIYNIVSD